MSREARNMNRVAWRDWQRSLLSLDGEETFCDQHGRLAEVGSLLIGVGPAKQIAILPFARGDFQAEGQSIAVPATRHYNGRNANHVYPAGDAMRTAAYSIVLGHGLIHGRHLDRGVYVAVKVEAVERFVVRIESSLARDQDVFFGVRVVFKLRLGDGAARIVGNYLGASNDRLRQGRTQQLFVLVGGVVLRWSVVGEKVVCPFAHVRQRGDVRHSLGKTVRKNRIVEDDGGAR